MVFKGAAPVLVERGGPVGGAVAGVETRWLKEGEGLHAGAGLGPSEVK